MKIGKYTIKLSEHGTHYMEILGGLVCIAVMVISLSAIGTWIFSNGDTQAEQIELSGYSTLQVTHIYEDGCIDLYDTKKDTYKFYCEDITFYE